MRLQLFELNFRFHLQGRKGLLVWGECSCILKLQVTVRGVVKDFLLHAMKTYGGSRSIAPFILNLGTRWRSVVSITPRPLCQGKGLRDQLIGGWIGPRCGLCGEDTNI
jgi:hypothetical protein